MKSHRQSEAQDRISRRRLEVQPTEMVQIPEEPAAPGEQDPVGPAVIPEPYPPPDEGNPPEKVAKFGEKTPLKRPAQPEELAPAYVFLASDADSSYITGEILAIMGGGTTPG